MQVSCLYCGKTHAWFQCPTKPEGWKPPAKEVVPNTGFVRSEVPGHDKTPPPAMDEPGAGLARNEPERQSDKGAKVISTRNREAYNAYQREYQRKRRARLKAQS